MNQFYPTPFSLMLKAWAKFSTRKITRILEPSAGRGDLISKFESKYNRVPIDCIEIDLENQSILRDKGYSVIDGDFLTFSGAPMYSHIIMNPPFNKGAEHVNHAFDLLVDGELVAIVNAETVRNPCTQQRKLLVDRIEQFGNVDFITEAFIDPDTKRKTNVEIALIWLEKKADIKQHFTIGLDIDQTSGINYQDKQELAIKQSTISNMVAVFNAAVKSLSIAEVKREEANYYASLLGKPLNHSDESLTCAALQTRFNEGYDDLKNRAWSNILNCTEFSKYLSSKAYEKLTNDFEAVKKLSFTENNIRGFLLGLVNAQSDMNMQMLLDCFDEFTKWTPENRAYYRGWKSNLRHKEQAYRIQMTRVIIPRVSSYWSTSIAWETMKKLEDFDKVFAMLDGKAECTISLKDTFADKDKVTKLLTGERLSTDYFDVRYYGGVKTIHLFPTNKKVIDRLNRLVGKERQWLPEDGQGSKEFWNQYDKAEQVTKKMKVSNPRRWSLNASDEDERERASELYMDAHIAACKQIGINTAALLSC